MFYLTIFFVLIILAVIANVKQEKHFCEYEKYLSELEESKNKDL